MSNNSNRHSGSRSNGQALTPLDFQAPNQRDLEVKTGQSGSYGDSPHIKQPWWRSQINLMICVFALLLICGLMLIQLMPSAEVKLQTKQVNSPQATAPAIDSPWTAQQKIQARKDSQEVLAELLEIKKTLEGKQVTEWSADQFKQALSSAESGDKFYKEQNFPQAIGEYKSALTMMQAIESSLPQIVASYVDQGNQAIEQGKASLAKQLFSKALLIDVNDAAAGAGQDRANKLDSVILLVDQAKQNELNYQRDQKIDDLNDAEQFYQEALAIDSQYTKANEGLASVQSKLADYEFKKAMSNGYKALFSNKYSLARQQFAKAQQIKPDDTGANSAYRQTLASGKRSSVGSLISTASRYEAQEDWQNALSNYDAVLSRDSNQVSAKLGKIRSQARAQLDSDIKAVLSDPLSISQTSVKTRVKQLLNDAKAIKNRGPKLSKQIAELESALTNANLSINVQLLSDANTQVSLLKVGSKKIQLGKFSKKNLSLKPGRYVLQGQRLGYRDVRLEIELVSRANELQSYKVHCTELI